MDRSAIMKAINSLEQKYPVSDWAVNDINIWPLVRVKLIASLYGKGTSTNAVKVKPISRPLFLQKSFLKLKSIYNFVVGWREYILLKRIFNHGIDLVFLSYVAHRQKIDGLYYNRFCDLFLDEAQIHQHKPLLLEYKGNITNYKLPRSSETHVFSADNATNYYKKIARRKKKVFQIRLKNYNKFLQDVSLLFGEAPSKAVSPDLIVRNAKELDLTADFFTSLYKGTKPKAIFCVSYYSSQAQGLILSAYRNNIKSIDIQHGIQGKLHEAYGMWTNIPDHGFNSLPQYFWNWTIKGAAVIKDWASNTKFHKSIVGGNPWLIFWEKNFAYKSISEHHDLANLISGKKVILYTLQPSFEPFPEFVRKVIEKTKGEFVWLIRMHPRQLANIESIESQVSELGIGEHIEIQLSTSTPLPILLSISDLHLTVYSTVAIESATFNIPTLFIGTLGRAYFSDQLPSELTFYDIEDETKLLSNIEAASGRKGHCQLNTEKASSTLSGIFKSLVDA